MRVSAAARCCAHEGLQIRNKLLLFYRDNSMLLSSITNVALNTVLLGSKLIASTPPIIPRTAFALLSFSGIISINVQGRDWTKHMRDCRFAWRFRTYPSLVLTAARVCIKGTNILLTCSMFAGALIALAGQPQITTMMFSVLRPLSLVTLAGAISGEFIDFSSNQRLLKRMRKMREHDETTVKVQVVAQNFLYLAYQPPFRSLDPRIRPEPAWRAEQRLALDVIRQMEVWTLDSFKMGLAAQSIGRYTVLSKPEALHVYQGIEKALKQSQAMTKANIGLRALGYISIGICRLFPQTLVQYGLTLTMSLFYTSKLIVERYFLNLLKKYVAKR